MGKKKVPAHRARLLARKIIDKLGPLCQDLDASPLGPNPKIVMAGSLRRGEETVGDIELVAMPKLTRNLLQEVDGDQVTAFLRSEGVKMSADGDRLKRFDYGGVQVDLYLVREVERWGWRLLLSTGSAEFNRWMVTDRAKGGAKPADVHLRDGFVHRVLEGGALELLETPTEDAVFEIWGFPWIPPAARSTEDVWLDVLHKSLSRERNGPIPANFMEGIT